jgi:hypothetical protein
MAPTVEVVELPFPLLEEEYHDVMEGLKHFFFCRLEFPSSLIPFSDHMLVYLRPSFSPLFLLLFSLHYMFLSNLFIVEIANHEVYIIKII